jgi:hypothetical protein
MFWSSSNCKGCIDSVAAIPEAKIEGPCFRVKFAFDEVRLNETHMIRSS